MLESDFVELEDNVLMDDDAAANSLAQTRASDANGNASPTDAASKVCHRHPPSFFNPIVLNLDTHKLTSIPRNQNRDQEAPRVTPSRLARPATAHIQTAGGEGSFFFNSF